MHSVFTQAMYSREGERVQLIQNISTSEAEGAVEKWLVQVEDVMVRTVRDLVARSRLVRSLCTLKMTYTKCFNMKSLVCGSYSVSEVSLNGVNTCGYICRLMQILLADSG